ncbi:hypothetical protein Q3V30_02960 [Erwinia pyri]|uniref:DUF4365 domain-containing protein n=1 Tax=Erwinia pyri TaxID=3062598 RepID=A0AA50HR62_9GAMM|nr:hypothetical protein [Erwinia sp. DE2]WLS79493.1 hypothetical protein Q3V30_02960 [Erwinia sp. DE2]
MSLRKVGNMGRGDFDRLCNASGLIYNSSSEDDSGGWDAIVEFPLIGGIALLNSLNEQPIQCLVQIKSTDGARKGVQVKVSNMKRFCDTPLPCFFFFARYDGNASIESAYLVHINRDIMFQVLKRIRQNDTEKKSPLHKLSFTVNYSGEDEIVLLNKSALKNAIEKHIPFGMKRYCEDKLRDLGDIGYKESRYALNFKIVNDDDYKPLINATLGYPTRINIKDVQGWDTRFDINFRMEDLTAEKAIIEITSVEAFSTGSIRFEDEKEDVSFKCEFFVSTIAFNAPVDLASFRIRSDFFDLIVRIKNNKIKIDFESYDKVFHLADLRELLLLMKILNAPNGDLKLTIKNNEGNETSFFASNNSFSANPITNEIIKAEQIALTLIQVASYFRVDKDCKVSLNELIKKQQDIERMHALISKVPGGEPVLRLEIPDSNDDIDSSKELRIFIAIPLFLSSFSICLACVAKGSFTYQNKAMTFDDYAINIEKLIRADDLRGVKKQCQIVSDKVNQRFENDDMDFYYYNSFSQAKP